MTVDPATRRANRWLFIALVIFALGLCASCLLWMRRNVLENGGRVYPPPAAATPSNAGVQNRPPGFATLTELAFSTHLL